MFVIIIATGIITYLFLLSTVLNRVFKKSMKAHKRLAICSTLSATIHAGLVLKEGLGL